MGRRTDTYINVIGTLFLWVWVGLAVGLSFTLYGISWYYALHGDTYSLMVAIILSLVILLLGGYEVASRLDKRDEKRKAAGN